MIPAELAEIYARVCYWVTPPGAAPYVLRVGSPSPELDAALAARRAETWAYLTAHNPGSQLATPEENARRQDALAAELRAGGYQSLPGYGEGLEGWPDEVSALVFGIEVEAARALAARYGQAAFLAGRAGGAVRLEAG